VGGQGNSQSRQSCFADDVNDRQTFRRILTTHVPENRWADVAWFEDED
jgi:hypothetical protein